MKFLILFAAIFIANSNAYATYYGCDSTYYLAVNYSGIAYGKEVESVNIHAGVLEEVVNNFDGTSRTYWSDVVSLSMRKVGDHFFAKLRTTGTRGGGSGHTATKNLGPVIQYWVTFTDGTTLISPISNVLVKKSFGVRQDLEAKTSLVLYDTLSDSDTTFGFETYSGSGCN